MLIKPTKEITLRHTLFLRLHHLKKLFNFQKKNIKKKSSMLIE